MFKVGIITSSDTCFKGGREDFSGKEIKALLSTEKFIVEKYIVLPDEIEYLSKEMIYMTDELNLDLILTTGGTGFSPRDVTPEATSLVCHKMAPGIPEAIRNNSLEYTKRAMLSRAVAGIRNNTLIVNLPGSPKAVKESLEYAIDSMHHGLEILTSKTNNCAR